MVDRSGQLTRSAYAMVPIELLELCSPRSRKGALFVYLWLWHYAGRDDQAFPSIPRLALECQMKAEDVRAALKWLTEEGWIRRIDRKGKTALFHVRTEPETRKKRKAKSPTSLKNTGTLSDTPPPIGVTPTGVSPEGVSPQRGTPTPRGVSPSRGRGPLPPKGDTNKKHLTREEEIQEEPLTPPQAVGDLPAETDGRGMRSAGTNPRAVGENPRALGTSPRQAGTNPRSQTADDGRGLEVACEPLSPPVNAAPPRSKKKGQPVSLIPLPANAPALPEEEGALLDAWWQRRCQGHKRSDRLRLSQENLRAIDLATEHGVLARYLEKARDAGWQSLGHGGARDLILALARESAPESLAMGGHHGNGMLRFGEQLTGYTSPFQRKLAAMERLFTPEDGGPSDDHTAEPRSCA